ncbi:very short patch repair endonuclease [Metapseudomonas otitidis]|uniref:very short patch repair endonuclease n=1 Tax=Metapseudomonas otitidis TaxID=319939 RepID=UPI003EE2EB34
MVDSVDAITRSRIMARVRSRDTLPELALRKELFRLGFRYRLHCSTLPGKPDIVFARYRAVVFVHGCFWHWHGCRSHLPATNVAFWQAKITRNQQRDIETRKRLLSIGWRVLVVWECALSTRLVAEAAQLTAAWLRGENLFSILEPAEKMGTDVTLKRTDAPWDDPSTTQ